MKSLGVEEMKYKVGDRVRIKADAKSICCKPGECGVVVKDERLPVDLVVVKWDNVYEEARHSGWSETYPPCASAVSRSDLESIPLTTGQMIDALKENPEARYTTETGENKCTVCMSAGVVKNVNLTLFVLTRETLDAKWTLISESRLVTFMEAVNAFREGKTIICKGKDSSASYEPCRVSDAIPLKDKFGCAITDKEILDCQWYIKEN